jgi:hypothetical protein
MTSNEAPRRTTRPHPRALALSIAFALSAAGGAALRPAPTDDTQGGAPARREEPATDSPAAPLAADGPLASAPPPSDGAPASAASPATVALLDEVLARWEALAPLPPGVDAEAIVVTWRDPVPDDPAVTAAIVQGVARRFAAGGAAWTEREEDAVRAFLADDAREAPVRNYVWRRVRTGADAWSVETVSWPTGNRLLRAGFDAVSLIEVMTPEGATAGVTVNEDHARPESVGEMGGVVTRRLLAGIAPHLRERVAARAGGVSEPAPSSDGARLAFEVEWFGDGGPHLRLFLPPLFEMGPRRGLVRGTLLLERDGWPALLEVTDAAGTVALRIRCAEFEALPGGQWLPALTVLESLHADGRTLRLGVRSAQSVRALEPGAAVIEPFPSPRLELRMDVRGTRTVSPLAGATPDAVLAEIETAVRAAQERSR